MGRILVNGSRLYLHGANYPWMIKNGKSNYGLDFGVNRWGTHEGVSTNAEQVERDFAEMQALGFNTLRWFVFTDGRSGITFESGMPFALAEKTFDDFDTVLAIADTHRIKIIFVLLDFLWLYDVPQGDHPDQWTHAGVLKSVEGQDALIDRVFVPLFERYADNENILAWEVMNEPDWVVSGLDVNKEKVSEPLSLKSFRMFVARVADVIHTRTRHLVTVGGGRIKHMSVWDDERFKLDLIQVHTYNDFLNHNWDERLYGRHFDDLNLTHPLLIGEFTTNGGSAFERTERYCDLSLEEYLRFGLSNGYAGSLFWSFNAVDKCGTEDRLTLSQWISEINLA